MGLLDHYPLDWTDPRLRELQDVLVAAIYRDRDIEQIVIAAGVPPGELTWTVAARSLWFDAMQAAARFQVLPAVVEQTRQRYPALGPRIDELLAGQPVLTSALPPDAATTLAPHDQRWKGFGAAGVERQIVEDDETLLDVSFLERGVHQAAAVCRLEVAMSNGKKYQGTAFRIGPRLLLTNHHVLHDWEDSDKRAAAADAVFGYELDLTGNVRDTTTFAADVSTVVGERDHDFAVIETVQPLPDTVPVVALGSVHGVAVDDRVIIVQHPRGLPKKIALAHNLVRFVDDDVVQYWTDTDSGSSGAPVFNERWELVALHHQWVQSPVDDGTAYRNQGRNIRRIIQRINALGVGLSQDG